MATTTNFGWETPDDTDLVKDGAAAMRTLGNSIDTSFVDLKGGTSGQILSKASNTDLDYTWVDNQVGDITAITATSPITGGGTSGDVTIGILDGTTSNKGAVQLSTSTSSTSTSLAATASAVKSAYDLADGAIPKSLIDAAGDLIVGTAADTAGRLGIGTAGQVLKVNSGATALEWGVAGSSGALTYISGSSFTSAASVSLDSVFTSTYQNYLVMLNISSGTGQITMRFRAGGSDNTAASYSYYTHYIAFGSSWSPAITNLADQTSMGFNVLDNSNYNIPFTIMNPQLAQKTQVNSPMTSFNYNTTGNYTALNAGFFNATTQFDGIKFSAGTSMTGTLKIYGIANS
jgi:hypothetical protein